MPSQDKQSAIGDQHSAQPGLPGLAVCGTGLPTGQRSSKPRFAASWSADSRQFADSLIAAWNAAFKTHGTRAYRTRRNHFVCIQLYRWLSSAENDAGMTEQDVLEAIRLYAEDPHIIKQCHGRFTDFGSWLRGCPENCDKQLARVGRHRGAEPANPRVAAARQFAEELLEIHGLGDMARRATGLNYSIWIYVQDSVRDLSRRIKRDLLGRDRDAAERCWFEALARLMAYFNDCRDERLRRTLEQRAVVGLEALRGPLDSRTLNLMPLELRNLRDALALALFAKEAKCGG
jgi:hypothetical protein